jgi:outer membrane porin, OprD family
MNNTTRSNTIALATLAIGFTLSQSATAAFLDDSKASLSMRNMYLNGDNRDGGADNREWAQGFKLNYQSGFTEGTVGFGLDAQGLLGVHLDGGKGLHPDNNTFYPSDHDGSAVPTWSTFGATGKMRISKTELRYGTTLAPILPILITTDGRLLPQNFEGGMFTSKEFDNLTLTGGQLEHARGRASSNYTGMAVAGGTEESNHFRFAGGDWNVTKNLTLQYYYANLEDYYTQHFGGLIDVLPIGESQTFKTDLRYFKSSADGANGEAGYRFNNNGGYARHPGEVDNTTWSAMFTYTFQAHSLMLGHQRVSDDGGFVWLNQGSLADEGAGGTNFYLYTDSMINQFARAGEHTTFGEYSYDFAALGVPGLKAAFAYLSGDGIKDAAGGGDHNEWERDMRIDYVFQQGFLKGFSTTLRQGAYRGNGTGVADQDQTRLIFNYTYNFL